MQPPKIQQNVTLQPYNTFGIAVKANFFATIHSKEELLYCLQHPDWKTMPKLVMGGGSNTLFTKNFEGLVIKINLMGLKIVQETEEFVYLQVGAGENWHQTVLYAIANDWGGIENLALIYGSVGAAPMQNIGAYGVELKQSFHSLEAVKINTGEELTFDHAACQFGYRQSIFKQALKNQVVITTVTLRLTKRNHQLNTSYGAISQVLASTQTPPTLQSIAQTVIQIRQSKLPNPEQIGNAGSFFKNPEIPRSTFEGLQKNYPQIPSFAAEHPDEVKIPAGWLIEQAGWKGKRIGNVGVHKDQALILVNYGGGTGSEIWELALKIQQSVAELFTIVLHNEVNVY